MTNPTAHLTASLLDLAIRYEEDPLIWQAIRLAWERAPRCRWLLQIAEENELRIIFGRPAVDYYYACFYYDPYVAVLSEQVRMAPLPYLSSTIVHECYHARNRYFESADYHTRMASLDYRLAEEVGARRWDAYVLDTLLAREGVTERPDHVQHWKRDSLRDWILTNPDYQHYLFGPPWHERSSDGVSRLSDTAA